MRITRFISIALKSREQGTSSPPCARSAEYFLRPVTVHSIVPPRRKNSELPHDTFHGKCRMIVPFSQPQRIDQKYFQALFRTPTTLQPPLPILLYMRGSLKYNHSFRKTVPWQLLRTFLLPAVACLSLRACAVWKPITLLQMLCCKMFALKSFRRMFTLRTRKFWQQNFPHYSSAFLVVCTYAWVLRLGAVHMVAVRLGCKGAVVGTGRAISYPGCISGCRQDRIRTGD